MDPDGILIGPQDHNAIYAPPTHPLVHVEFEEVDFTSVLNWLLLEELDILVFSAGIIQESEG